MKKRFGPSEIATATSIGVFGNQLGSAIGFLVPPSVVLKSDSVEFMQKRFYYLLVPVATLTAISFILAVICNKKKHYKLILIFYKLFYKKSSRINLKNHRV